MLNFTLANIFTNLAEIYKGKGGNYDTVMEFTKAARTIRDYSGDIAEAYENGKVKNLPGITDNVFNLLSEYFKTGQIKDYEKLKELYSEDLIKFIRVSGLGKSRVFKIYDTLKLKNIDDLKNCIDDKTIYKKLLNSNSDGQFSNFTNDNITSEKSDDKNLITKNNIDRFIYSFEYFEKIKDLYPKGYTDFFLGKILDEFYKLKELKKAQITGSIRRKKPFIKDIDILVLPEFNLNNCDFDKSEKLLKSFLNLYFIKDILKITKEIENISASYKTIFDIDLEVIITTQKRWVIDLFITTGNKNHVLKINNIAKSRGINLDNCNDYSDDFAIYKCLNMQYILPELRENNGEIELAQRFSLPKLIEVKDIKGDLHIHSPWSDGLIEIEDIITYCKENNYEYFSIADHTISNKYGNGLDSERMIKKINYIKELRKKVKGINILIGAEVDIKGEGKLDYDDMILKQIEFVLASMHSSYLNTEEENTIRIISAIENKFVDAIAHPTGVVFGARAPYQLKMEEILNAALKNNKALEINSYLLRLDLDENFARHFKNMGGKLVINTDSHRIDNLSMIKLGVEIARRAWLEKDDVINTLPLKELRKWKKSNCK